MMTDHFLPSYVCRALAVVVWLAMPAWTSVAQAQSDPAADAVDSAAQGLRRAASFPWYDRRNDSLQPIDVAPNTQDVRHRDSRWTSQPSTPATAGGGAGGRRAANRQLWSGLQISVWVLLIVALIALLGGFAWALFFRKASDPGRFPRPARERQADTRQIENLPFALEPDVLDLLADARRRYEQGDYGRAMILLFSHLLVQLDHHQFIQLARGKTNRQYLRELKPHPSLQGLMSNLMTAFEDVFFGGRRLTQSQFDGCWDQYHQSQAYWESAAE